jgi:hypothetical protein
MSKRYEIKLLLLLLLLVLGGVLQACTTIPSVAETVPNYIPVNHPPHIINLKTSRDIITPSGNCHVSCIASDEDGDEVGYEWIVEKGEITGGGYKIIWSAPGIEGIYAITVRVNDTRENVTEASINVTVKNNNSPTINTLYADVEWLAPFESCNIVCRAKDPDGDKLNYNWTTLDGSISGTGPIVVWTANGQPGPHNIMVIVDDGYGGSVARLLTINVAIDQPPKIEEFVVTASESKYFKKYEQEYKVLRGISCQIECIVADYHDHLVYDWFAEKGEIYGEGAIITWVPPQGKGEVTLVVTVTDEAGNKAENKLIFKVETCSCVFS